jgi:hypothetical protein
MPVDGARRSAHVAADRLGVAGSPGRIAPADQGQRAARAFSARARIRSAGRARLTRLGVLV